MKKISIIILVLISVIIYFSRNQEPKSNIQPAINSSPIGAITNVEVGDLSLKRKTSFVEQCPSNTSLLQKELNFLLQKKKRLSGLFSGYFANSNLNIPKEEKELIIQLMGIPLKDFAEKYHETHRSKSFQFTSSKKRPLSDKLFNELYLNLTTLNYSKISELILNNNFTSAHTIGNDSILSFILKNSAAKSIHIDSFLKAGLVPSFNDIRTAIQENVHIEIIKVLHAYFDGDITATIYEDFQNKSLSMIAIEQKNKEAFVFFRQLSSPLKPEKFGLNAMDAIAPMPSQSQLNNAIEIFKTLADDGVMPYSIHTESRIKMWLPKDISNSYKDYFQALNEEMKKRIENLPIVQDEVYTKTISKIKSLKEKITSIENQILTCDIVDTRIPETYPLSSVTQENSASDIPTELKANIVEMQMMLDQKNWAEFIDKLYTMTEEYDIPEYKNLALMQLIQKNSPLEHVSILVNDKDVTIVPETLAIAIMSNNVEAMKLLIPLSLNFNEKTAIDFLGENSTVFDVSDEMEHLLNERVNLLN